MENFYNQIKNIASKYRDDNIYIVGKGASIDNIDLQALSESLVINLNDSSILIEGSICIFNKEWVFDSLKNNNCKSDLYITDKFIVDDFFENVYRLEYVDFSRNSKELFVYRFLHEEIKIEEFLFLTAAKLCRIISEIKSNRQNVYFLGFDFSIESGIYSKRLKEDYSGDSVDFKSRYIQSQEFYFIELLNLYAEGVLNDLTLIHVGNKVYSKLSPHKFNVDHGIIKFKTLSNDSTDKSCVKKYENNKKSDVIIVAELTNNHLGDPNRLRRMIVLAKQSGADLIKVQKRDVESFYSQQQLDSYYKSPFGNTLRDYRRGVELDDNMLNILDKTCKEQGIDWFATILDIESFHYINDRFPISLLKIPSTISEHREFHKQLASVYKGDIVISTGYTDSDYEEYVLDTFKENTKIYLLQCTSAYPTKPYDCNVSVVRHYNNISLKNDKIIPGYSSHDIGSLASMLSVGAGGKMIEKHVKLGNTEWIHFDSVALDLETDEFSSFVKDIRLAEQICGNQTKYIIEREHHKYLTK